MAMPEVARTSIVNASAAMSDTNVSTARAGWAKLLDLHTGQKGTVVAITGTDLRCGSNSVVSVTLDGVYAKVASESNTSVVVEAAAGTPAPAVIE